MTHISPQRADLLDAVGQATAVVGSGKATLDQVQSGMVFVNRLKEVTRMLAREWDEAVLEWIDQNGDLTIGDIRYYAGTDKKVKLKAPHSEVMDAVLAATDGDIDQLGECLASDAWKHGATRALLGDAFDRLFSTEIVTDLKTGKPRRSVHSSNDKFLPARKGQK